MTEKECLKALENMHSQIINTMTEEMSYDLLNNLIKEHFYNPPLKLEELEDGEWYWNEIFGWCLMNFYVDLDGKDYYKATTISHGEIDMLEELKETTFHRKEVE